MPPNTSQPPGETGKAAEYAAFAFYTIAALGSTIGQIWVGIDVPPWPHDFDAWLRGVMVLPFAVVLDLGGVVCSAFADTRQRLGERAYGWRILSAATVGLGVGINIVGHAGVPYLAVVFGGLGVFAYCVWLLHSGARRRDALRASSKLADTAPAYGFSQWRREPAITYRAKMLALEYGYGMFESLTVARTQLRDEERRAALSSYIKNVIQSRHKDPVRAAIAGTTSDTDAIAAKLLAQNNTDGWAQYIGADLAPPTAATPATASHPAEPGSEANAAGGNAKPELDMSKLTVPSSAVLRQIPTEQTTYDQWRDIWMQLKADPAVSIQDIAAANNTGVRTVQRIRVAGATGWLDSPYTPVARVAALAMSNGHVPPLVPAT